MLIPKINPKDLLRDIDKPFWILFLALVVVAFIALFSAGSTLAYEDGSVLGPFYKQFALLLLGTAVAFGVQYIPSATIRFGGYFILAFAVLCLYLIVVPGSPFASTANEAGRWFDLFGLVTFQPSELAKLGLTIVVADLLSRIKSEEDYKKYFFWTLGLTVFTCIPILIGNLSTVVLIAVIVLMLWILARIPGRYIWTTIGIVVAVAAIGFAIVEVGYVRPGKDIESGPFKRATVWVKRVNVAVQEVGAPFDKKEALDAQHYQRTIAKVAVARGGKTPIGVLPGHSQERDFLPLAFMDYIFAIIVEETGLIGALFLIFIYLAILFRACWASSRYADSSAMLVVMGLALMLTCQALISMAVSVGLGPVTGQPLPLISKGGTSVLITSLYFGIMMAVAREQALRSARQEKTKQDSYNIVPDVQIEASEIPSQDAE